MVTIGGRQLILEDYRSILCKNIKIALDKEALNKVEENYTFLKEFSREKIIYGINTGFGPMSQYKVEEKDQHALQYNLIRSHAAGTGSRLSDLCVKSMMVSRLNTLMRGYSGIHTEVPELIRDFINHGIYPVIPEHGGVGASGDLVQLAHLALALIGEGDVVFNGKIIPAIEAIKINKLNPVSVHIREGLALVNGTSSMSGIGIVNILFSKKLLDWSVAASAMINELIESYDDHYSYELNRVKLHEGQNEITEMMQRFLKGSKLVTKREDHLFNGNDNCKDAFKKKIQEYYSIRCITQILGPVLDTIKNAEKVLINEVNSVNDNPIIDHEKNNVYHGGNFHGDYVSLEMDKLKLAVTRLSMLAERQINFLMNKRLNNILPPFVNLGVLGLNLGMQGAQFTATSTVAENQALSNSMYVHSIPTNNDNQDIVSMGTNSALLAHRIINNAFDVLAIEFLSIIQAIDFLKVRDKLSYKSKAIYSDLRKLVPVFMDDSAIYKDIIKLRDHIKNSAIDT